MTRHKEDPQSLHAQNPKVIQSERLEGGEKLQNPSTGVINKPLHHLHSVDREMLNRGFADEAGDKQGIPWAVLLSEKLLDHFYTSKKNSNDRLQMTGLTPSPE